MRSGDYRIWKMSVQGGDATQITPDQGVRAFEMTHESGILYLTASIVSPLWQLKNSRGKPIRALEQVLWFNFSLLDKRGAYYIDRSGTDTRLQYLDFKTNKSQIIARNLGEVTAGLTTTPDGKTVLFSRVDSSADDLMLVENFK
jgi:Tol biopolymer transport system component